jgi:hypothetical protein
MRRFSPEAGARKASLQYTMKRSNSDSILVAARGIRSVQYTLDRCDLRESADWQASESVSQLSIRVDRSASRENLLSPGVDLDRQIRRRVVAPANFMCRIIGAESESPDA